MTAIYVNYRKELINGFILVKMDKSIDHAYIVNIMQSNYLFEASSNDPRLPRTTDGGVSPLQERNRAKNR